MKPQEPFEPYTCLCGHFNTKGLHFRGQWCCEICGTLLPPSGNAASDNAR